MVAPLPYILIFAGYTIVLTVDRVVFDSHALFDDHGDGVHGHGHEEKEGKDHHKSLDHEESHNHKNHGHGAEPMMDPKMQTLISPHNDDLKKSQINESRSSNY